MNCLDLSKDFQAIWRRSLQQPSLDALTPSLIESWARERGLVVENTSEQDVGAFIGANSIVLAANGQRACFPKISPRGNLAWEARRKNADHEAALWEKMEWFAPLWVPRGRFQKLLKDVAPCSKKRSIDLFNYHTSTIYSLSFQATCIAQIMPRARSLQEFSSLAREAYLAFYSGYRASSIAALIPVIEGALSRIVSVNASSQSIPEKINTSIDKAIRLAAQLHFDGMWAPSDYLATDYLFGEDERVFFFETFRRWLLSSFFKNTGEYTGTTWLNRHLFAHATSSSWQESGNFARLVVALATIGVVESWHDGSSHVSLFWPEINDDSRLLWHQAVLHAQTQAALKSIEEETFHKHGRLVPEMPTDNGVLLRAAILADDCIRDLVRPLRNAGWSVDMGEPDDQALYVTVNATSGDERLCAALLYSCATDNQLYRRLAEFANVILYRGAPYKQDQYAFGIMIHVGPVAGWRPPPAPGSAT